MPDIPLASLTTLLGGLDRLSGEVSSLRTDMQALVQGLTLMVDAQEAQGEMLGQILAAASQEPAAENPMQAVMQKLTQALDTLTARVASMEQGVGSLGQRIGGAIIRGASSADPEPEAVAG